MMGDTAWLAQLFETEAPQLRRFLRKLVPHNTADDLAQETFARLCAVDPDSIQSPRSYLFRTARNLAINEARHRNLVPIQSVGDPSELDVAASDPSPEDNVTATDELAQLRKALAALPSRQRQALIFFKLEGLSHREIGQRLGVSHRTVERYIADALAHCHHVLRKAEREG